MFAGSSFSWLCRVVDKQQTTNMARTRIKSKRPSLPTRSLDSQSRKRLMNMFSGFICCFFCLLERVMGFLMAPPWQAGQTAAQHQHECGATAYPKGNGGRKHTRMCCCCLTSGNNFQKKFPLMFPLQDENRPGWCLCQLVSQTLPVGWYDH